MPRIATYFRRLFHRRIKTLEMVTLKTFITSTTQIKIFELDYSYITTRGNGWRHDLTPTSRDFLWNLDHCIGHIESEHPQLLVSLLQIVVVDDLKWGLATS